MVKRMSEQLREALEMSQTAIRAGLDDARAELEELQARQAEVQNLIAQAEAALGMSVTDTEGDGEGRMTLHTALEYLLREDGNRWMSVRELSDEVNRRGLYRKKDGTPVEPNQVHARTKNYEHIFEKDGPRVRLRGAAEEWDVVIFRDDDAGFYGWLDKHPDGSFVNAERNPKPTYLVLHNRDCSHFDRSPKSHWTKDYIKICSDNRGQLEGWAEQSVGGEVTLCKTCFG
jgi:hypothetical protein